MDSNNLTDLQEKTKAQINNFLVKYYNAIRDEGMNPVW